MRADRATFVAFSGRDGLLRRAADVRPAAAGAGAHGGTRDQLTSPRLDSMNATLYLFLRAGCWFLASAVTGQVGRPMVRAVPGPRLAGRHDDLWVRLPGE